MKNLQEWLDNLTNWQGNVSQPEPQLSDADAAIKKQFGGFSDYLIGQPIPNRQLDAPDAPPPVNEKIKAALQGNRQPANEQSVAPPAPAPEEQPTKVSPWAALASGIAQTIGGSSHPDLSWVSEENRSRAQEVAKRIALKKQEAQQKFENDFKEEQLRENIASRRDLASMNNEVKRTQLNEKQAQQNSLEGKLQKLNSGDKARLDNARMVVQGLDEMEFALSRGDNTFSLIGDNDYTAAARRATEGYGRMQSGGAINKEEEKRFDATLPQKFDTTEMQKQKIATQRAEMLNRIKTLGFTPEELGINTRRNSQQSNQKPKQVIQNGHTYILNESTGEYE